MSIWNKLLAGLGIQRWRGNHSYELGEDMHLRLQDLAAQDGRREEDLAADLMARGLSEYYSNEELWQRWGMLSVREQEVVRLTCLGYTNRQIAYELGLSIETVKSHLRNALIKFQLHSKAELRLALAGWVFDAWTGDM
jgi:DNA-binding CsgD family transcriptional regulator